jgi:hypothetical protein
VVDLLGSLVDAVRALVEALERAGIDYALGGAVALSAWSEPRATTDVDINIWPAGDSLDPVLEALVDAGVAVDPGAAKREAELRGMFVGRRGPYRIDVFVPSIPFYADALATRRRVAVAGTDGWVLSAESIAVFKMLFFRPKDLVDVARLLEVARDGLDRTAVRAAVVAVVGEDDVRVARWDEMCGA